MNEDVILISLLKKHPTYYSNSMSSENLRYQIEADNNEQVKIWKDIVQQLIEKNPLYSDDKNYVELLIETCASNYSRGTSITHVQSGFEVKRLLPTLRAVNFYDLANVNPTILLGAFVSTATVALNELNITHNMKCHFSPMLMVSVAKFEALKNLFPVKTSNDQSTREINEKIDELKARQNALEEAKALKGVSNVWNFRSRWLNLQFWIGLITITATVGFGANYFLENAKDLLSKIPTKVDGDIAYGTLALTFVPIIAVGWVLRIIGRSITSSLTLKEDADHRRSMLETYFNLISDPNAKFEDKERSLILNAIFRPLPGQHPDEVAPPTLPDLIKDHFGGKDSK
jgi:hypothetical protein